MIDYDLKLSTSFRLAEFCRSEAAARAGIVIEPTPVEIETLKRLCAHILQPLRDSLAKRVRINSGLRPLPVNTLIGGASNSAHITARAADIEVEYMANFALAKFIRERNFQRLDKCILEFPSVADPQAGWVHVQIAAGNDVPRGQYLTAKRIEGATKYLEGLTV